MKFIYFGYDTPLPSILRLIDEGHELCAIFSFECDNIFNFNQTCQALCQNHKIPFILSKPEDFHIQSFLDKDVQCLLSAGYPYKIPFVNEQKAYSVNVHPTYLPHARGIMPIPHIILNNMNEAAGITAHKITQEFDAGDILLQTKFTLDKFETIETYSAKTAIHGSDLFSNLMKNLPALWNNAAPQNEKNASQAPAPNDQTRTLDWTRTPQQLNTQGRAFGRFGCLAPINDTLYVTYHFDCWQENHDLKCGTIAAQTPREITIAIKNGFICLKDNQPANI